ncbi:MAG: PLP-dependent aminotransferase family protein [Clostridiales bacterium]|nr:PLP-dependent aminotransferase family protein [Clostridiales bacterium]
MYIPVLSDTDEPLYIRLYRTVRADCFSGVLRSGDRLPSRRKLARELRISVNTVDSAYQQLVSEGYIESLPRSGYVVRALFAAGAQELQTDADLPFFDPIGSAAEPESVEDNDDSRHIDFSPNGVDLSALPVGDLKKMTREVFSMNARTVFGVCEAEGHRTLRTALCRYLAGSRGILCTPDRIIVGAGTDYILQFLVRLLRLSGHVSGIATENPVYNKAFQIFSSLGETVVPLPLDEQGLNPEALRGAGANVAYVTPSHQFPLGVVMPAGRRAELLAWAARSPDRYIIEDDYDSEFRYSGRPIPSLFSMSTGEKVIYLGSFSKSIAPSVRVSYLVLPRALAERSRRAMSFLNTTVSVPDQLVLARFIETGLFERHINRMRTLYRKKKDVLVRELSQFGDILKISGTDAGLHLICTLLHAPGEKKMVETAADRGVAVYGISDYFMERGDESTEIPSPDLAVPESTVLIGYGGLDVDSIVRGCRLLLDAWSNPN